MKRSHGYVTAAAGLTLMALVSGCTSQEYVGLKAAFEKSQKESEELRKDIKDLSDKFDGVATENKKLSERVEQTTTAVRQKTVSAPALGWGGFESVLSNTFEKEEQAVDEMNDRQRVHRELASLQKVVLDEFEKTRANQDAHAMALTNTLGKGMGEIRADIAGFASLTNANIETAKGEVVKAINKRIDDLAGKVGEYKNGITASIDTYQTKVLGAIAEYKAAVEKQGGDNKDYLKQRADALERAVKDAFEAQKGNVTDVKNQCDTIIGMLSALKVKGGDQLERPSVRVQPKAQTPPKGYEDVLKKAEVSYKSGKLSEDNYRLLRIDVARRHDPKEIVECYGLDK